MILWLYICRHKALKDLQDEIFNRHVNLRDMASGLVYKCNQIPFLLVIYDPLWITVVLCNYWVVYNLFI